MDIIICYFIIYIAEAFILWHYCSNLFIHKYSKYREWLYLAPLYLILFFICTLQENVLLNQLAFLTANFIYMFITFETRWLSALFHAAITTGAMGMSETLVAGSLAKLLYDIDNHNAYLFQLIFLTIFTKTLYFLVLQIIIFLSKNLKDKTLKNASGTYYLTAIPIITTWISAFLLFFCITEETTPFMFRMFSISAFLMFVINFLIYGIYRYTQRKEAELAALRLQLQKEYDAAEFRKTLLEESESKSILIHDIKKHLLTLADLNEQGEQQRVASYISTLVNSSSLRTSVRVSDNDMLNVILCRYINICRDKNIAMYTDIRSKCLNFMSDEDMTALFCNLLDNAMDAAYRIPEGYIEVTASRKEHTAYTLITVINSCCRNPIDEQGNLMIFKPNKELHGFGMKSVARIVSKYLGEMHYYYDDDTSTFHVIMIVKDMRI